ncbi:DUF3761 domain-containing protein [Streptomyces tubercidicus]
MPGTQRPMGPEEKKNARLGCAMIAAFVLLVGGCVHLMDGDDGDDGSKSSASSSVSEASDATDAPDPSDASDAADGWGASDSESGTDSESSTDTEDATVTVPDYTGRNLQESQDDAQGRGLYLLDSRDLSVRQRTQVWDRNWQVCDQEPAAGTLMADSETLTFTVVRTSESCGDPDAAGSADGDEPSEPTDDPAETGSSSGSGSSGTSGSSGDSGSSGGGGQAQAPAGASAQCNDGTYSHSQHRRGTCSHHHGVATWLRSLPA